MQKSSLEIHCKNLVLPIQKLSYIFIFESARKSIPFCLQVQAHKVRHVTFEGISDLHLKFGHASPTALPSHMYVRGWDPLPIPLTS